MSADKDDKPIVIKQERMDGVDKTYFDYAMTHTVPIAVTKVSRGLVKKGQYVTIGLEENLNVGNVIQLVYSGLQYKIIKFVKITDQGRIYRIKRTDGSNITGFDISSISVGDKVRIKSRVEKYGMYDIP